MVSKLGLAVCALAFVFGLAFLVAAVLDVGHIVLFDLIKLFTAGSSYTPFQRAWRFLAIGAVLVVCSAYLGSMLQEVVDRIDKRRRQR